MTKKVIKKKVVSENKTQARINPGRVKKPLCEIHNERMSFDMMRQVFICPNPGCKLIARPKRGDNDKSVVLGKGAVQMRLICQDGGYSVILISDDNVAVNITGYVNLSELFLEFGVEEHARIFRVNQIYQSVKRPDEFLIAGSQDVPLKMSLLVMGATEL